MGVAMGNVAFINGANTTRQWRVDYLEEDRPYAASNTQQGTGRGCATSDTVVGGKGGGVIDWTGQYLAYGAEPFVFTGDPLTFVGASDTTIGASGTAITERVQIAWNQEDNDYVQHIVNFAGNGDLTLSGTAEDTSIPAPKASGPLKVYYGSTEITDIRRAYLDFRMTYGKPPGQLGNRPYASSAFPGKTRRKRSRLDFSLWVDCYVSGYSLPTLQEEYIWKFYTTDTLYWELKWGRVTKIEDIGANVEDAELMHVRIHAAMRASDGTNIGYVKSPGAVQRWPFAA